MNVSVDSLNFLSQTNCTSDFVKAGSDHKVCFVVVVVVGNILKKREVLLCIHTEKKPFHNRKGRVASLYHLECPYPVVVSTTAVVESSQQ